MREEILKECTNIVDMVCEKNGYDTVDKEENDSLRTVLLKAIPSILKDKDYEDRQLFYQMLEHTPIVITENLTEEGYKELEEKYIGNVNPHILKSKTSIGEYGKTIGKGAYVSEPILDENLNLQGKKSFIYVQKVNERAKEFLGTDINVAHLIHELGHAWHAEKDEYEMQGRILRKRVGTSEILDVLEKNDDKYIKKYVKATGVMVEEGMNTIAEEKALADYKGIPLEEMKKIYKEILDTSNYQGYISDFVSHMVEILGESDFEKWRLHKDEKIKERIEELMKKTDYWKNREEDILPTSDSHLNYKKKKEIIEQMKSSRVQEFFNGYEDVYFPDVAKMTPLEKVDNVLMQIFNMKDIKYNIELENYKSFLGILNYEGYPLINEAGDLKREEELKQTISNVKLSDMKAITIETKDINNDEKTREEEVSK